MSITDLSDISANLLAAQDNQSRKPLVSLISAPKKNDIPFDGLLLTNYTEEITDPQCLTHSTGKIVTFGIWNEGGSNPGHGRFIITDVDRIEFFQNDVLLTNSNVIANSICEKTDGDIGLVYQEHFNGAPKSNTYFATTIDITDGSRGSVVFFGTMLVALEASAPWVQTVGSNNYLMVYSYITVVTCSAVGDQLTFVASTRTIENLSATFVADGFVAGQTITVSGTDFNDGTYILETVATDLLTLTDTAVVTDEAGEVGDTISRNDYFVYGKKSVDFVTWTKLSGAAGETQFSIAGLVSTSRLRNFSIIEISGGADDGDLWMWFDVLESVSDNDVELTNLYYSVSSDLGVTWGTAVKVTNKTTYGDIVSHPIAVQRVDDTMDVVYNRDRSLLHKTTGDSIWAGGASSYTMNFDSVNSMLYIVNYFSVYQSVVKIDVDTWTVVDYWNDSTTSPAFPSGTFDWYGGAAGSRLSEGPYSVLYASGYVKEAAGLGQHCGMQVWFLDDSGATSITHYIFDNFSPDSWVKNMDIGSGDSYKYRIDYVQFSLATKYIYLFARGQAGNKEILGYIDTTLGTYQTIKVGDFFGIWFDLALEAGDGGMYVDETSDQIVLAAGRGPALASEGSCVVINITSGAIVREWSSVASSPNFDPAFPQRGLKDPFIYNDKVYAGLHSYSSDTGYHQMRGLCELDIITGVIINHRPSFSSDDDFLFSKPSFMELDPVTGNPKLLMGITAWGICIFDTVSQSWELFNEDTVPNFPVGRSFEFHHVTYDATGGLIMFGEDATGVYAISKDGNLQTPFYIEGAYGTPWTFADGDEAQFVEQLSGNSDAVVCKEPSTTSIYAFWEFTESANTQLKWDKDGSSVDISQYIINNKDVTTGHSISGSLNTLDFALSHGHLFDPNNISSLLSATLQKGRKIELMWGETISGSPDWCNGGDFFVVSTNLGFDKGSYPEITVHCEDQRTIWQTSHIFATSKYSTTPDLIMDDLLETWAGMLSSEIEMPTFVGEETIYHQWIDTNLESAIDQIMSRFGYFFRFDIDGVATVKQISNALSVDHTYSDNTKLITYTPDDRYSDFTNQIMVQCEERDPTQVLFAEERIERVTGTLGWWGCTEDQKIWFSDDKSRRCLYPYMKVIDTAESMAFRLAGSVDQQLIPTSATTDADLRYKYCTLKVTAPSLIPHLVYAIGSYIRATYVPDEVVALNTVPVGRVYEGISMFAALMILGSEANYQIEVWARPLGEIRRSVQATWDDTVHQAKIGNIVNKAFEDNLCYDQAACQTVADFEGMVVQMQRKRITITKIAHLQDEEGDTIRIFHPYGLQAIDLFITDIKRRYKKGTSSSPGYFTDEITGWVI